MIAKGSRHALAAGQRLRLPPVRPRNLKTPAKAGRTEVSTLMGSRTRAELAREILSIIQAVDTRHGAWLLCHPRSPSRRIRSVCPGTGWHAWISTASEARSQGGTTSYRTALQLQACRPRKLRYLLEVWADGFGKVLSAEFEQGGLRLISMKGGNWPALYFGIES